jgi:hypothetical protein
MAYVSKELKVKLTPMIKSVLTKYKMKGSISVSNHSTLVVKVTSGAIDFGVIENNYSEVNEYYIDDNYKGVERDFIKELLVAMKGADYFCNDDSQSDYFHRSHYTSICIGTWKSPYVKVA